MSKKFVGEPFCVSKKFWYLKFPCTGGGGGAKKIMDKKGYITFFRRKFFVSHCRKTSWGNPYVFQKCSWVTLQYFKKFGVSKNFMHNRGVSRFFVGNFLSHSAEKIRREILRCFRDSRVLKNFIHKGGSGITILRRKFLSHFTEKLREGPFSVWQIFGYRKIFCMRRISGFSVRGGSTIFCRLFYVSQFTVPKLS